MMRVDAQLLSRPDLDRKSGIEMAKTRIAILALLVAPISLLVLSVSGFAQPLINGEAVGDWKYECVAVTEKENRCALTQIIMLEDATAPVARISLTRADIASQVMVSILTPLGVQIEAGAALIVGEQGIEFPYVACFAGGCLARGPIEGDALREFITTDDMGVAYSSLAVEGATIIPASARGLLDALDRASFGLEE
jgi:invasion protein IalB